jgi:hypothetical protein
MNNQALTIRDDMSMMDLGTVLAKSGYFNDARDAAQAVVKVLAGREMGFGPVASMTGINIIKGRVSMGANLIASAVKRSGRYDYRVKVMTEQECTIEFYERTAGQRELIGVSTFTKSDAAKASTQNMDKFPRNMLFARAMSNGAKWFCADVFGGPIYTPEELGEIVDEDGEIIAQPVTVTKVKPEDQADESHDDPVQKPAPKTTNGANVKRAVIKTPNFPKMLADLQAKTAYYNDKDGEINGWHVTASVAKIGYTEITDDNMAQVLADLVQHAQEQTAEVPA